MPSTKLEDKGRLQRSGNLHNLYNYHLFLSHQIRHDGISGLKLPAVLLSTTHLKMATSTSTSSAPTSTSDASGPSCTTAVPGKYGHVPITACNSYYNFDPSFGAAVAVSVIFGVLTLAHLAEAVVFRKRYAWVLVMGALWETLAFVFGALGAHDQQSSGFATAHQLLFLLAPLWINAFVYMTFSRMVYCFLPDGRVWVFRATGMSKWFVWADILSFVVQAVGGIMTSPGGASNDIIQTGLHIYMAGIGCQEFFILCFLGLMIVFHRKALQFDARGYPEAWETPEERKRSWKGLLYALYTVLAFISVSIRRLFSISLISYSSWTHNVFYS